MCVNISELTLSVRNKATQLPLSKLHYVTHCAIRFTDQIF